MQRGPTRRICLTCRHWDDQGVPGDAGICERSEIRLTSDQKMWIILADPRAAARLGTKHDYGCVLWKGKGGRPRSGQTSR